MSDAEKKLAQAKALVQEWVDKQGHERCWYYPEMFTQLATIFDIKSNKEPALPPRKEFEEGCRRYQKEEYEKVKTHE